MQSAALVLVMHALGGKHVEISKDGKSRWARRKSVFAAAHFPKEKRETKRY
jgi:hypothetical protein